MSVYVSVYVCNASASVPGHPVLTHIGAYALVVRMQIIDVVVYLLGGGRSALMGFVITVDAAAKCNSFVSQLTLQFGWDALSPTMIYTWWQ